MKTQPDWKKRICPFHKYMSIDCEFCYPSKKLREGIDIIIKRTKLEVLEDIDTFLSFNRDLGTKPQTATIIAKEWEKLKTSLKGEK